MRLTLHAAGLQHVVDPTTDGGQSLSARFIALHPTAFHQNGGWVEKLLAAIPGLSFAARFRASAEAAHQARNS